MHERERGDVGDQGGDAIVEEAQHENGMQALGQAQEGERPWGHNACFNVQAKHNGLREQVEQYENALCGGDGAACCPMQGAVDPDMACWIDEWAGAALDVQVIQLALQPWWLVMMCVTYGRTCCIVCTCSM